MTEESEPYISFVVTSRNDDHGGNQLRRMQIFVTGLLEQAKTYDLSAELILVEWNPVSDRPPLRQVLSWPEGPCRVRIIEVPSEIHNRFRHSDRIPLFQMIAKNVGIRRAKGRFVLATNIDLLFSEELASFLASKSLKPEFMYRIDRYDVSSDVPSDASIEERLKYCRDNVIRVNRRDGTYPKHALRWIWLWKAHRGLALLYGWMLLSIPRWRHIKLKAVVASGVRFLRKHVLRQYPRLHTNACGDFTLMAKEDWLRLRGYPELEMYPLHPDSLLCYMASSAGIREVVMRHPVYHVEHSGGWTPEVESDKDLRRDLSKAGIPQLTSKQLGVWAVKMFCERKPIIFNLEDWGLADRDLPETTV